MTSKSGNNYNNFESIWATIWDLGYNTSQYLAYCVGMASFTFTAFVLLSTMVWCCVFMPPVAVFFRGYLRDGNACTEHMIYNIVLCFFLWVPGMGHAFCYCFGGMFNGTKKENYNKNVFERPLPAETLLTIFCFINSTQLGNPVAMASRVFLDLAHVRLHEKDNWLPGKNVRMLRPLRIGKNKMWCLPWKKPQCLPWIYNITTNKQVAFPECALPNNIVGFTSIEINHFDAKVLSFFSTIRPLLNNLNIIFGSSFIFAYNYNIIVLDQILGICGTDKICSLNIENLEDVDDINVDFPSILPQIRRLFIDDVWDCENCRNIFGILLNWLSTKSENDQPKLLLFIDFLDDEIFDEFLQMFNEKFLHATTASPSIIGIELVFAEQKLLLDGLNLNNLVNLETGERLTVQIEQKKGDEYKAWIKRHHRIGKSIDGDPNWQGLDKLEWYGYEEAINRRQTLELNCID